MLLRLRPGVMAMMAVVPAAMMMARGVVPGFALVCGHAGMRLLPRRHLSPTGQSQ
jgi:hypothetical protein